MVQSFSEWSAAGGIDPLACGWDGLPSCPDVDINTMSRDEAIATEAVMIVALSAVDDSGLRIMFHLSPSMALGFVRAARNPQSVLKDL